MEGEIYDPNKDGPIMPMDAEEYDPAIHGEISALEKEIMSRVPVEDANPVDGPKGQEAIGLPPPNTRMYDGMDMEDAQALYEAYARHPATEKTVDGQIAYKGQIVNFPESQGSRLAQTVSNPAGYPELGQEVGVGQFQKGAGIARNIVKNTAKTGLALGEMMAPQEDDSYLSTIGKAIVSPVGSLIGAAQQRGFLPTAEDVDKGMAEYNPGGVVDTVTNETVPIVAGGIGGAKAVDVATKSITKLPQFFKTAAKFVGGDIGAVMGMDEDTGTLVTGDKALFELWGGVPLDANGKYNENLLKKKLNVLADAALIATPAEKGLKGAAWLGKFFNDITGAPLKTFLGKGSQEEHVVRDMIGSINRITDSSTAEEVHRITLETAEKAKKFAELRINNPVDGGEIVVPRDTMGALEKGTDVADTEAIANIRGHRTAIRGKGATQTEAVLGKPAEAVEDFATTLDRTAGGSQAVDETMKNIQTSGAEEVRKASDDILPAQGAVGKAEKGIDQLISENPTFGPQLKKAKESGVDFDVKKASIDKKTEIVKNIDDADEASKSRVRAAFNAIPDSAPADTESWANVVESASGSIDAPLKKIIDGADGSFKYLYNTVRPKLSSAISSARASKDFGKMEDLMALRDNIDQEQLMSLKLKGSLGGDEVATEAGKRATEAMETYKKEMDTWGQGAAEEFRANAEQNKRFRGETTFPEQGRQIVESAMSPNRRESTKQMMDILATPEGKNSAHLVKDVAIGDALVGVSDKLATKGGKLSDIDVEEISKPLREVAGAFTGKEAKEINDFLTNLRNGKWDKTALEKQLADKIELAKKAESEILDNELGKFFEKVGETRKGKTNGQAVFEQIFNEPEGPAKIKELIKRARQGDSANPLADAGLKAAWSKYFKDQVFRTGKSPSGSPLVNENTYEGVVDAIKRPGEKGTKTLLELGDEIFKDTPEVMVATKKLLEEAGDLSLAQSQRSIPLADTAAIDKQAREATGLLITLWRGSLDRLGARIRATTGRAITTMSKNAQVTKIMDEMYADPKKFSEIAKQVAQKDSKKLDQATKDAVWKFGVRAGIYSGDQKEDFDSYFMDFAANRNSNKTKLKQQTEKAVGK